MFEAVQFDFIKTQFVVSWHYLTVLAIMICILNVFYIHTKYVDEYSFWLAAWCPIKSDNGQLYKKFRSNVPYYCAGLNGSRLNITNNQNRKPIKSY